MATAASFAVSAAFFYLFACGGKHSAAIISFGFLSAIGAIYLHLAAFNKLFKILAAFGAFIL